MEFWEIDVRSRKTGNSIETIYSGESHDAACECLDRWYEEHPDVDGDADRESLVDGSDGTFADIYCTETPHGLGPWHDK